MKKQQIIDSTEPNVIFTELKKPTPFIGAQNSAGGDRDKIRLTIHDNLLIRVTYYVLFKTGTTGYIVDAEKIDADTIEITVVPVNSKEKIPPVIIGEELIIFPG